MSAPRPRPTSDLSGDRIEGWVQQVWREATGMHRVLLAVTDEQLRALCRTPLLVAGYLVSETEAAILAVDLARFSPPEVAVFDLRSQGIDGWGALRAFRAQARTAAIPVVGLVQQVGESEIWHAREFRVSVLVPLDPEALLEAVDRLLELPR